MGRKPETIPIKPIAGLPLFDAHCHFPSDETPKGIKISLDEQYNNFFKDNGQYIVSSASIWGVEFKKKYINTHENMLMTIGWGAQSTTYATPEEWDNDYPRFYKYLEEHLNDYVAIGEIGIDFHHAKTFKKREHQIDIFEEIIQRTKHLKKPYSLHVRNPGPNDKDSNSSNPAYNDRDICNDIILDILESEKIPPSQVMWHCFSGPPEWGPLLAEKGYYLSIPSSAYGFRRWRNNIADIPLSKILTETDASAQHPIQMGAFNMPENVRYSIAAIAYVNELDQKQIANKVLENSKKFFGLI